LRHACCLEQGLKLSAQGRTAGVTRHLPALSRCGYSRFAALAL
jgi:hypothetical protein